MKQFALFITLPRPPVYYGSLSGCDRPRDGVVCELTCDRGYSDIESIECKFVGSKILKLDSGEEFRPHKWIVEKPGTCKIYLRIINLMVEQKSPSMILPVMAAVAVRKKVVALAIFH